MEKTTKYLRCHTGNIDITVGKRYEVVDTADCLGNECYVIIDDASDRNHWPIEIDAEGESYRDWFTLETDADSAGITLLPDESLGGVLREYREVKRKADVGETVKVVASDSADNGVVGSIGVCTRNDQFCDESIDTTMTHDEDGFIDVVRAEYVVLEPTEILVINNERFRMVDRKAVVGDRVIMTAGNCAFSVGQVITVHGDARIKDGGISYIDGEFGTYPDGKYALLEPLTSADSTLLSALPLADQYAENITVLTRKIAQLEKRNTALESRILALETDSSPSYVKVASGPVDNTLPTFSKAPKSAQQIRDEIVERAKADISNPHKFAGTPIAREELRFWPRGSGIVTHTVEYVVSSDKRTVVALVIETYGGRKIVARGIAKCAPGETFNAHIGRAIALYRALGLEVPTEYLTCPQPEEVRVGDVVLWTNSYDAADTQVFTIASVLSEGYRFVGGEWDGFETVRVIDDSREDDGISAASSALKGAA
ncbi:hypothetical protein MKY63_00805 [Paenibacillus sp. FSL R7-0189]|uniref:hypothetical protein n=1 Tax=Paenibacillus sp. FSL R7-0189 TaxID=2921673 RepID=UPI0030DA3DDC